MSQISGLLKDMKAIRNDRESLKNMNRSNTRASLEFCQAVKTWFSWEPLEISTPQRFMPKAPRVVSGGGLLAEVPPHRDRGSSSGGGCWRMLEDGGLGQLQAVPFSAVQECFLIVCAPGLPWCL